jgi:hypothetical protein
MFHHGFPTANHFPSNGLVHVIAGIKNLQLELPALETHQHLAEILPGDFLTIDNDKWHATVLGFVPLDSSPHRIVSDLRTMTFDLLNVLN